MCENSKNMGTKKLLYPLTIRSFELRHETHKWPFSLYITLRLLNMEGKVKEVELICPSLHEAFVMVNY